MRRYLTCLALCLATCAIVAVPAQADQPPLDAAQSGAFVPAHSKGGAAGGRLSAQAAAGLGGCYFTGLFPHPLGHTVFQSDTFSCSANLTFITASGCIHAYTPNNGQWFAIGCNSTGTVGGSKAFLAIAGTGAGCHTYEAWGSFAAWGLFQQTGGPWVSASSYFCA